MPTPEIPGEIIALLVGAGVGVLTAPVGVIGWEILRTLREGKGNLERKGNLLQDRS